jgi:hypothetical protein
MWGGLLVALLSLAKLTQEVSALGIAATWHLIFNGYHSAMNLIFGWAEPYIALTRNTPIGPFPSWWHEGLIMLALIVAQWSQIIADGKAEPRDGMEYFAASLIAGAGSYLLGAASSLAEAIFFGIAGVFAQMLARGIVSFLDGRAAEPEAWAGRYLLRSTSGLILGAGLFFASTASLNLMGF